MVRATGGLDDTIQNFDAKTGQGTGFKFDAYDGEALLQCVRGALKVYKEPKAWRTIQANGMAKDFSWKASAAAYVTLYEAAKRSRIPRDLEHLNVNAEIPETEGSAYKGKTWQTTFKQ